MMKNKYFMQAKYGCVIVVFLLALLCNACGGHDSDDPSTPAPGVVTLTSPIDNSTCLKSLSLSGTRGSLKLSWNAASDADSYIVEITNLNDQTSVSYTTTDLYYTVKLDVNTPYSWKIDAVNTSGSTSSAVWKFYLSGAASNSYAPFPAELTAPAAGAILTSTNVTFLWAGSDPDNDIVSYVLYLDNTYASTCVVASQKENALTQTLVRGKTYYWKIVTTDKAGNSSSSIVRSFQIK